MKDEMYENMFKYLEEFAREYALWSTERKRRAAETVRVFDSLLNKD